MGRKRTVSERVVGHVDDINHDGLGVIRIDGKVWFVDAALPGEEVAFWTGPRRRGHGIGRFDAVLSKSDQRTEPPCEYFGTCGGCALQHMNYPAQLDYKRERLLATLTKIGQVEPDDIQPDIFASPRGYRRRARLGVRDVEKKGGILVGFRERRKSYVTPLAHCLTLHERAQRVLPQLSELISGLSVRTRVPQVEIAAADNALALIFRHLDPLTADDSARLKSFASAAGVQLFVQPGDLDSVRRIDDGPEAALFYRLDEYRVTVFFKPTDFIQINGPVNEKMVDRALRHLSIEEGERIVDFYCGLGNFSLPMARLGAEVTGFEGDAGLVERANDNARFNQLTVKFERADLDDAATMASVIRHFAGEGGVAKVMIDPPRSGAMEVVKALATLTPQRVVYVSCNPATLARDAQYLVHVLGYRLTTAGIVDMFPHTAHIESMAVFEGHD